MLVEQQEPLIGTTAGVVRIGDTVRRPSGPWAPTVRALLAHLAANDFPAPRPLGIDEEGREVLSWVPGNPTWLHHAHYWASSENLKRAATLIRSLHDIFDSFEPPPGAAWRGGWDRPADGRGPICHHDLAPWNMVMAADGSMGVIDWEGAGPGNRMRELAYAISGFVPLRRDAECRRLGWRAPPQRAQRVELFRTAYGLPDGQRAALGEALVATARGAVAFGEQMYAEGREPWATWWAQDKGAGDRDDLATTESVVREWCRS